MPEPVASTDKPATQVPPGSAGHATYFGPAALITAILGDLFLGANLGVAYLKISAGFFDRLNNLTALLYCILTPLAFIFGVVGHTRRNDWKNLSRIAMALAAVPFTVLFMQLVSSFLR